MIAIFTQTIVKGGWGNFVILRENIQPCNADHS